ncbi:Gfo/Idh/MocA family oxidoreductase [Candidatus Thioglobus sp.]|nr:Gfo/Idh/MocA family oxidoreductase [Candidatus Thioglobus sp.]
MSNKKQRIGIIGAGWWAAAMHIPTLVSNSSAEIAGICATDTDALKKVQDEFGISYGVTDYRQLLSEVDLDGVIISSPHTFHFEHAKAALEAGCHVLVEKPFTTDSKEAKELIDLAAKKNLNLNVSHGWNYMPIAKKALKLMRADLIGEFQHAAIQLASPTSDLIKGKGLSLAEDALLPPLNSTWADPSKAGGYGWGQLTHLLGLFFKLVDEAPKQVFAFTSNSEADVDYYNSVSMRLESGATCSISGSSNMPAAFAKFQVDLKIFGSKGNLMIDLEPGRERVLVETFSGETHKEKTNEGDGEYDGATPANYLVDVCAGTNSEDMAPGIVGYRSVCVVEAMLESSRNGNVVNLS